MIDQTPDTIKLALKGILEKVTDIKYVSVNPVTSRQLNSDKLPAIEIFWAGEKPIIGAINGFVKSFASIILRIFISDEYANDTAMIGKLICNSIIKTILHGNVRLPDINGKSTCVSCDPNVTDAPLISANRRGRVIIQMELAIMYYYRT